MFVDTHVHLNSDKLYIKLDEAIAKAQEALVSKMIVVGYNKETSLRAIQIAEATPLIYASIGFHPTEVSKLTDEDFKWLKSEAQNPKVVAIGECGYDFYWDKTTKYEQEVAFKKQIAIAKEIKKPLIIHSRDAMELTLKTLISENASEVGGVMHSYSGSRIMVDDFIKIGFYIGIGGPVTFLNALAPKEVVKAINPNYLLSETDAPYLTPHPFRGKENGPHHLPLIVEAMAKLKEVTIEEMASTIQNNVKRLFKI